MPNKANAGDERDESAPVVPSGDDRTERHLLKARELLREARSRLSARDDGANVSTPDREPSEGGSEEP
jgi:hypothetical protein